MQSIWNQLHDTFDQVIHSSREASNGGTHCNGILADGMWLLAGFNIDYWDLYGRALGVCHTRPDGSGHCVVFEQRIEVDRLSERGDYRPTPSESRNIGQSLVEPSLAGTSSGTTVLSHAWMPRRMWELQPSNLCLHLRVVAGDHELASLLEPKAVRTKNGAGEY